MGAGVEAMTPCLVTRSPLRPQISLDGCDQSGRRRLSVNNLEQPDVVRTQRHDQVDSRLWQTVLDTVGPLDKYQRWRDKHFVDTQFQKLVIVSDAVCIQMENGTPPVILLAKHKRGTGNVFAINPGGCGNGLDEPRFAGP